LKRIRIKDIATRAGVSTGTVDRVLHQRGEVSVAARSKVNKALEELGYERNFLASTLAFNRTYTIGVLLPFPETDDYWQAINQGVIRAQQTLQHFGLAMQCHYFELANPRHFAECANRLLADPPAAFLFAPLFQLEGQELAQRLQAMAVPYLMINSQLPHANALCYVGQDAYQAGFLAGRLLGQAIPTAALPLLLHLDQDAANAPHLQAKAHGFKAYFTQQGLPQPQVIEREIKHFNSPTELLTTLQAILNEEPKIGGIFVTSSRAHLVAAAWTASSQPHLPLIGFDPLPANLAALRQGKIHALIHQHPKAQGYLGLLTLSDHLLRKATIPPLKLLPLDIVLRENMDYLDGWDILVGLV